MGRWRHGIRTDSIEVVRFDGVWLGDATSRGQATTIIDEHNADCAAYEARIAELEAALETESQWLAEYQRHRDEAAERLARIAALVKPVPVADLVEAGTEAPALLAERHRQIRAILEDEG